MIKRSLITALCIFIVYNIFLIAAKANWTPDQYLYQGNIIKADRYLYHDPVPRGVMVGTSLSSRVVTDSLGIYNLAMPGMGLFDGLEVLLAKKATPKFVFVEINYFYKPEKKDFVDLFKSKQINFLKSKLSALRDENQPIGISYNIAFDIMGYIARRGHPKINKPVNTSIATPVADTSLYGLHRKIYTQFDTTAINQSIYKLQQYVVELNKRGSRVCFFEMPVNAEFMALPFTAMVRNDILKKFPQYTFISIPNQTFVTSDGIHLGPKEALDYTMYFKSKMLSIGY